MKKQAGFIGILIVVLAAAAGGAYYLQKSGKVDFTGLVKPKEVQVTNNVVAPDVSISKDTQDESQKTEVAQKSETKTPVVKSSLKIASGAQCLKDKGAVLYGAFWCPHCTAQKAMFGASAEDLPYVECSTKDRGQTKYCEEKNITSYPTWIFADGTRMSGEKTMQELFKKTNCTTDFSTLSSKQLTDLFNKPILGSYKPESYVVGKSYVYDGEGVPLPYVYQGQENCPDTETVCSKFSITEGANAVTVWVDQRVVVTLKSPALLPKAKELFAKYNLKVIVPYPEDSTTQYIELSPGQNVFALYAFLKPIEIFKNVSINQSIDSYLDDH